MKTNVIMRLEFEAIHCWPECPFQIVSFLKNKHRHIFKVTCKAPVGHDDRDIEFILCKQEIERYLRTTYDKKDIGGMSCEMLCKDILSAFPALNYVCVEEDGENGAEVHR
jgi:hypothetical protein